MNPNLVDIFLESSHLEDMLQADRKSITDFAMRNRSFDDEKLITLIDESPLWAGIIAAHIHIDHVLGSFLSEYCVRPNAVNPKKRRLAALDKATFLYGVGVLSEGSFSVIRHLNRVRNTFAHSLIFEVPEKEVDEYRSTVTSSYSSRLKERPEYQAADNGKIDFQTLLKISVVFVEEERLAHLIIALRRAHSEADLQDAMSLAQKTLSDLNR